MKTTKTKTSGPGAYTACRNCPVRKLPTFRAFAAEELAFMEGFKAAEVRFSPGSTILLEGTHSAQLYTIFAGWAFRLKTLSDGRRQILNFVLPGDFIGLQGAVFDKMQHTVEALTDTVLCVFPREKVWSLFERHPSLGFDAAWLASREETMLDEHLLSVGQRRASERMSYLLLHLFADNLVYLDV